MGHHHEDHEALSHEELKYREHTERAMHFIRIDLFRSAREEYKAALAYKPQDPFCVEKINEMNRNISRDRQTVLAVVPVVVLIIVAIAIFA